MVVERAAQRLSDQRTAAKEGRLRSAGWAAAHQTISTHATLDADAAQGISVNDGAVSIGDVCVPRRSGVDSQLVPHIFFVPLAAQVPALAACCRPHSPA
jgi:hypothetical protein